MNSLIESWARYINESDDMMGDSSKGLREVRKVLDDCDVSLDDDGETIIVDFDYVGHPEHGTEQEDIVEYFNRELEKIGYRVDEIDEWDRGVVTMRLYSIGDKDPGDDMENEKDPLKELEEGWRDQDWSDIEAEYRSQREEGDMKRGEDHARGNSTYGKYTELVDHLEELFAGMKVSWKTVGEFAREYRMDTGNSTNTRYIENKLKDVLGYVGFYVDKEDRGKFAGERGRRGTVDCLVVQFKAKEKDDFYRKILDFTKNKISTELGLKGEGLVKCFPEKDEIRIYR